ncbi:MAG: phage major capsid protein [Rhizobiaceae bacterium]
MDRAYSFLEIKSFDDEQRIIRGVATTPSPDRVNDIVEPLGVAFKNPLALLWQHRSSEPIGTVNFDKPTAKGITFEAKIAKIDEPGKLKDRLDEAWQSVKAGLVRAVSIGFRAAERSLMDNGGIRFVKSEVYELSLVTIPANAEATINEIRSIDAGIRAASGQDDPGKEERALPGDSGKPQLKNSRKEKSMTKTVAEQIADWEATRVAKSAKLEEIMQKSAESGETLDEAQEQEYEELKAELKKIDAQIVRLGEYQDMMKKSAKPVGEVKGAQDGSESRSGAPRVTVKANVPKGTAFTRYAMALAVGKGNLMQAEEFSKRWHDTTPEVNTILKAAVAAGNTTNATWAAPLVEYTVASSEFAELLRPATIMGKIQGMRRVPFNIKIQSTTAGSSVGWVGQGAPKPVSKMDFASTTFGFAKAAGIVVITQELARFSDPSAEALIRNDLIESMAQFLDAQFLDPAVAAVANVSPAAISNGITPTTASGTTAAALRADIQTVFNAYITSNLGLSGAVWVMPETVALTISLMQNALGQQEFPGMGINGGTLMGLPVVTSENLTTSAIVGPPAWPAGKRIFLIKANEILMADDGQTLLDASAEASLQMDTAPVAGAQSLVSLWQNNLVALRAERIINWGLRRTGAVRAIAGAAYVA